MLEGATLYFSTLKYKKCQKVEVLVNIENRDENALLFPNCCFFKTTEIYLSFYARRDKTKGNKKTKKQKRPVRNSEVPERSKRGNRTNEISALISPSSKSSVQIYS